MSVCNKCAFDLLKREARKKGKRAVTLLSIESCGMGGVDVHILSPGEKASKKNWRCWYMELPQTCRC